MKHKLIIDGNAVYEIDDDCVACKAAKQWEAEYDVKRQESEKKPPYSPYGKREKTKEK